MNSKIKDNIKVIYYSLFYSICSVQKVCERLYALTLSVR